MPAALCVDLRVISDVVQQSYSSLGIEGECVNGGVQREDLEEGTYEGKGRKGQSVVDECLDQWRRRPESRTARTARHRIGQATCTMTLRSWQGCIWLRRLYFRLTEWHAKSSYNSTLEAHCKCRDWGGVRIRGWESLKAKAKVMRPSPQATVP
jgi:hypothetical protein